MKYSIKTLFRTPIKTIVFIVLLAVVTMFLLIGSGIWDAAENMLDQADATFITAGEFVYEEDSAVDMSQISLNLEELEGDEVLLLEENYMHSAVIDGYKPLSDSEYVMLRLYTLGFDDRLGVWNMQVTDSYYAESDLEGKILYMMPNEDISLERGSKFIAIGRIYKLIYSNYKAFEPLSKEELASITNEEIPTMVDLADITAEEFWDSETGDTYNSIVETLKIRGQMLDIVATKHVDAVNAFHMGEYTLTDGRFFSEEEYQSGDVCIIPKRMATKMGVEAGDTIFMSVVAQKENTAHSDSYVAGDEYAYQGELTIVGMYEADDKSAPVYIPDAGWDWLQHDDFDTTYARVVLDNRRADEYIERISQLLPDGVMLDSYDQGYAGSVKSINNMLDTASMILALGTVLTLLVIVIFSYLYISSNKVSIRVLWTLGTTKRGIAAIIITGSSLIAAISVVIGGLGAYLLMDSVVSKVFDYMQEISNHDLRFSIQGYGVASECFLATPTVNLYVIGLLALLVFVLVQILCGVLLVRTLRQYEPRYLKVNTRKNNIKKEYEEKKEASPVHVRGEKLAMKIPTLSLRYSLRSLLRSGARSLLIPVLFLVTIVSLCTFVQIRDGYESSLQTVYDDVPVTMVFTDITGRSVDNLVIQKKQVEDIEATGFVQESWHGSNYYARYMGTYNNFDYDNMESMQEVQILEIPSEDFPYARETFISNWKDDAYKLVMTEKVDRAAQFYYTTGIEVVWAECMDWGDYNNIDEEYRYKNICIVPWSFLQEYDCELGDIISLAAPYESDFTEWTQIVITIGGYYVDDTEDSAIYITEESWSASLFAGLTQFGNYKIPFSYGGFLLQDTDDLSELRDFLEQSYDQIRTAGANRRWIMIDDIALYDTIDNLTRYITFMKMLYPVILVLVMAIGFVMSDLMVRGRKHEMLIQRSLGVGKIGIFISYFLESLIQAIPGIILGVLVMVFISKGWNINFSYCIAAACVCYFIGEAAAIWRILSSTLLQSLGQKED